MATFPSLLDYQQIIQQVYDEDLNRLRVDSAATVTISGDVTVEIDAADGDNIAIANSDGSKKVTITTFGSVEALDVNIANDTPIDVNVSGGSFQLQGLDTEVKAQAVAITDTPLQVVITGLNNQDSISIRVWGDSTVFFGGDNTVDSTNGYPKLRFEEIILDVTESGTAEIWAVCDTGETSELRLIGLA